MTQGQDDGTLNGITFNGPGEADKRGPFTGLAVFLGLPEFGYHQ